MANAPALDEELGKLGVSAKLEGSGEEFAKAVQVCSRPFRFPSPVPCVLTGVFYFLFDGPLRTFSFVWHTYTSRVASSVSAAQERFAELKAKGLMPQQLLQRGGRYARPAGGGSAGSGGPTLWDRLRSRRD